MLGAIIGDVIGSIHENIPKKGKRETHTLTDDSILTYACQRWTESITEEQLIQLKETDFNHMLYNSLKSEAIRQLKENFKRFQSYGFSTKFSIWAQSDTYYPMMGDTNGCLMRQSPIPDFCARNDLNKDSLFYLVHLFASITHDHILSHTYTKIHAELIFDTLKGKINKDNYKIMLQGYINIHDMNYWIQKSKEQFIWSAKSSLQIALTCLVNADSFNEVMSNCIAIGGDVDTYCAIAGPMAEALFGIEQNTIEYYSAHILQLNTFE